MATGAGCEVMRSAAEHAFTEIPDRVLADDEATCAYNPLDTEFRVINASAYRAFLLFAAAGQFDRDDYRQAAQRNLNFVLRAQKPDGSWPYATDGVRDFVDHFHTCFVLKALAKIEALTGDAGVQPRHRGRRRLLRAAPVRRGRPAAAVRGGAAAHRLQARAVRLRRVHQPRRRCCAADSRRSIERLATTLSTICSRAGASADGSFRSRKLMLGWDNVPMHRWAQAQLFRSLALLNASQQGQLARDSGARLMPRRRQLPPALAEPAWRTDAATAREH